MIANNILALRKAKGFTQIEFAKKLGVTQSAVSHWENGRTVPDTLQMFKIAELLEVTVDTLLAGANLEESISSNAKEETAFSNPKQQQILYELGNLSEEQLEEVLRYAEYVKQKK